MQLSSYSALFRLAIVVISVVVFLALVGYRRQPRPIGPLVTPTLQSEVQENKIERLAKVKLAEYLKIEPGQIEVVHVERVDWPDASLGAPEEGMFYAQVIISGFRVKLLASSISYDAHTDEAGEQIVLVKEGIRLK